MENQSNVAPPATAQRKGLAITSLVLGIIGLPSLGLCFVGGIAGIIIGTIALGKINRNPWLYAGRGIAIAGIVTSSLSLLLAIPAVIVAIAVPNLLKSQQAAHEAAAINVVQRIGNAQALYSVTKGHGKFTNLETLSAEGLIDIDGNLASREKDGYLFTSEPVVSGEAPMFDTTAKPVTVGSFGTGNRSFGSNETFVVYQAEGAVDVKVSPINRVPIGANRID